jgi:molecular chaperone GrpE (heat shock protein)
VIEGFAQWLDALAEEDIEAIRERARQEADVPDLLTLYGEVVALRQDMKLQATASRKAGHSLESLADVLGDRLDDRLNRVSGLVEETRHMLPESRREGEKAVLLELVSIRESLFRVTAAAEARRLPRLPWPAKHARVLTELRSGQRLVLDKLDDVLRRWQVVPTVKPGVQFDPAYMRAVATSRGTGAQEGEVTEVVRQGYQWNGKALTVAEVQVEKQT